MRARRKHSREFKVEAVKLVRERGVTMAQAALDLDLSVTLLRKWSRQFAADPKDAFPGQGQQKPADVELTQLRREVARLKMERDILKKPRWIQSVTPLPAASPMAVRAASSLIQRVVPGEAGYFTSLPGYRTRPGGLGV